MTDIVERLRREGVEFHEQLEAADEIEKLRAQLQAVLKHVVELRHERDIARAGCARLRREIEDRT